MVKERDAERSKQAILNAAEQEFSEKGFYGARINVIAESAGINKRMIYAYFGSKEELYELVLTNVYRRIEQVEKKLILKHCSGKELIIEIISAYFDFLHNNPSFVNILMWENLNEGIYLKKLKSNLIERTTIAYFVDQIEAGKESGIFRAEVDAWQTVLSLITTCFANFSNKYTLSKLLNADLSSEAIIESRKRHTIDMILNYLCHK